VKDTSFVLRKKEELFVQIVIHTEKVQSCLAECQCSLGQVWCDEKTKKATVTH